METNKRGKLIALFGIDGSGKSTIATMLRDKGLENTVVTSCFHNAVYREELRTAEKKLNFSRREYFSFEFKQLLFYGSAVQKMYNEILPLLESGTNVIVDRYLICVRIITELFTSLDFHCNLNMLNCMPMPDLGIYFEVDINKSMQRIEERYRKTGTKMHFEYESNEILVQKKEKYENIIPAEKYKIVKIDANQNIDNVFSDVLMILEKTLGANNVK